MLKLLLFRKQKGIKEIARRNWNIISLLKWNASWKKGEFEGERNYTESEIVYNFPERVAQKRTAITLWELLQLSK